MKGLNDTDLAIIALLQIEGRATFAQIAQQVGLSPAAVHERVKKLEARGVITGYKAVVDPEKLGAALRKAFGRTSCRPSTRARRM